MYSAFRFFGSWPSTSSSRSAQYRTCPFSWSKSWKTTVRTLSPCNFEECNRCDKVREAPWDLLRGAAIINSATEHTSSREIPIALFDAPPRHFERSYRLFYKGECQEWSCRPASCSQWSA